MKNIRIYTFIVCIGGLLLTACTEVTSIKLSSTEVAMSIGQTESLTAILDGKGDFNKQSVKWTSSNSHVKVIDGKLIAISTGSAIITAQSGDEKATCNVTVSDQIEMKCNINNFYYYGDAYETKNTANFGILVLASRTDTISLQTFIPATSTTLTDGEYRLYSINTLNDIKPYRIFRGFVNSSLKRVFSWHFGKVTSAIILGKVTVANIQGNYTIDIDLTDEYGNRIYGSYEGELIRIDMTKSGIKSSLKNDTRLSSLLLQAEATKSLTLY